MQRHPYISDIAVLIGLKKTHWITRDKGETWDEFTVQDEATIRQLVIGFHATDPDRMIFHAAECTGLLCHTRDYYTTDGFRKGAKLLHKDAINCMWAKTVDQFTTGDKDLDNDRILCNVRGKFTFWETDSRLLVSDDFFETEGVEPALQGTRPVPGVVNLAAAKSYFVAAAKSEGSAEMAMYVTDDTKTWHRAEFGTEHKLEESAYTLLEGTNYSMQVDVMTTGPMKPPMGALYTSNSNGTFFTKNVEHTNRNMYGLVDFEKVQNIQGIVMVNIVDNWEEVEVNPLASKDLQTRISFDDGRTWQAMQADGKDLHLHSVTDQRNEGRIFSSPAPGIVMGVGNTGKHLKERSECDTWVSDDAGMTWTRALKGPHLFEFGDQGALLVAIESEEETNEIRWSLDHGKGKWNTFKLEHKVRALTLTTAPDSTSLKFILTADKGKGSDVEHQLIAIDFSEMDVRKCGKKDFEDWYARKSDKGEPECIMGHTQMFRRRKADAECLVDDEWHDPTPVSEDCKCKEEDYECDFNFSKSEKGVCEPSGPLKAPESACRDGHDTFQGSSGYRLIPGNTCIKEGGVVKDEPVERKCDETKTPPASGEVNKEITTFKGDAFVEYYYLERCETCEGEDETVIMRTDRREAYLTSDHGKTWTPVVKDEEFVAVYPHEYNNDRVYLVTPSKTVFYSENRGKKFHHFEAPEVPNMDRLQILGFHPKEKDWLIWTGGRDCDSASSNCQTIAYVSKRNGEGWEPLLKSVRKCQFVYRETRPDSDQLVYCEQYEKEDPDQPLNLLSSTDWFEHKNEVKRDVISFATMAEYIVVALRDEDQQSLKVDASIDGLEFADANFPSNFKVAHQQAYTVLDSSTHSIFLHVTVNNRLDQEYGSILKSNSNGTNYILAISEVNRNKLGYVDFEKMQGLEGVALVNVVANAKETDGGAVKKLKTMITHNDGAEWDYIQRPENPKNFKVDWCDGSSDKCALHLHGYTERDDPRDTFSSPSAVGLMMAVGNVGDYLGYKKDADTFITRDGGITWSMVNEGTWMWEYGDQGSIITIVKKDEPVKEVLYTLNEGIDWLTYTFTDEPMVVDDITTVPSDTSRNFLLWGKVKGSLTTVNLDFSGLKERNEECRLDEKDPESSSSDYSLWEPKHPLMDDNCLFGHVAQYHRKKIDSECYNGRELQHLHSIARNCTCTRRDFECDYNFERQSDGTCKLVEGLEAPDPAAICKKDKNAIEYYDITGYRRIPLTTCEGGQDLEYTSNTHPCPGKEPDYEKKHSVSGVGLFFAIFLPIAAAAGVGYWVWKNWDGKFGRIQLGDGGAAGSRIGMGGAFDREAPWIKYPVLVVSGIVAVVAALPMVAGSIWNAVSTRFGRDGGRFGGVGRPYTSRSSFSRGRGGYSVVDPDDGELLGEDSEDEV
ncbi:hypothetical protein WHR41_08925 [Cladosporium halotolerans]|uniref:Vacuolar protein sorting/targeting protein 10 n=1 Tax=Cladosporium halotolerans TaxID=1052096 RepID=A0AB34KF87_9PEZI